MNIITHLIIKMKKGGLMQLLDSITDRRLCGSRKILLMDYYKIIVAQLAERDIINNPSTINIFFENSLIKLVDFKELN